MIRESRNRTIVKTFSWRIIAVLNAYIILSVDLTEDNFLNALFMNISGLITYYFFDRLWSKVNYGRTIENDKGGM
jgi:uncharacterized membrane protein